LLTLPSSIAACQVIWSYDDFKDQPGTGGSAASGGAPSSSIASSTASSGGSGGASSGGPCVSGPPGMACTDSCDQMAIALHQASIQNDVKACTVMYLGNTNPDCIAGKDGLSVACADCWAAAGSCGYVKCLAQCAVGDPNSAACNDCLAAHCDCAFTACSGIVRPAEMDAGSDAPCD
jgi:hypothetical protein